MNLSFDDFGKGNPVVLIHAFPLSRKMWKPQIELLTAQNFRVILPDLRGFGDNHSFSDINTMEDMANDIAELLNNLKIERAIIGGLSMGGYVTFNLFRLYPEKFAAILLCDTTSSADTEEKREARFDLIEKIEKQGAQALIENMLPNLISDDTKQNNPDLGEKLEKIFSEVNPKAAISALRGMAERKDHTGILSQISLPTALIFGEFDKVTNLENAEQMHRQIPDSTLAKIEKAGHFSNLEQPELFNEALLNFCKSVKF